MKHLQSIKGVIYEKTRYGDCYTWVDYNYFFFDKNGRITKKISFNIVDDVFMGSKRKETTLLMIINLKFKLLNIQKRGILNNKRK